jgi:hypothetical protein
VKYRNSIVKLRIISVLFIKNNIKKLQNISLFVLVLASSCAIIITVILDYCISGLYGAMLLESEVANV